MRHFIYLSYKLAILTCLFAVCMLPAASGQAQTQNVPTGRVSLPGHFVPQANPPARLLGRTAPGENVSLALTLPLRDQAGLSALLRQLYNPHSPQYGHYLASEEFTRRYGPSEADYAAVASFARKQGLTITRTTPNRLILNIAGAANKVETAFGVHLMSYQANDGRHFHAPDAAPTIPTALAGTVVGVIGLNNCVIAQPHLVCKRQPLVPCISQSSQALVISNTSNNGGLTPSDITAAYNVPTNVIPNHANGAGRTLVLYELDGYTQSDITTYEQAYNLPNVSLQNILVGQADGSVGDNADEVTLDIELMIALAPGVDKILVYEGKNGTSDVVNTYNQIATDNLAKEISTSWGIAETESDTTTLNIENAIFQQMAAQGQSIYAASGDSGAYDDGQTLSVNDPASQPYVTAVGGTTLSVNAPSGSYQSETTWAEPSYGLGGGGGISQVWSIPDWQVGANPAVNGGSSTMRNVPDISLNADPRTGYFIYYSDPNYGPGWYVYGGTSAAAPLWAAFTSLVNQLRTTNGLGTLGFANPAIYQIAEGVNYGNDFHDIADGSNNLYYVAGTGYDDATGWGSFNGANLLADLAVFGQSVSLIGRKQDGSYDQRYIDCYNRVGPGIVGSVYKNSLVHVASGSFGNGTAQDFVEGTGARDIILAKDNAKYAFSIRGSIWTLYSSLGYAGSSLGFPISDMITCYPSRQGTTGMQAYFEGGTVYSGSGSVGTHILSGDIFNKYAQIGQTWSGGTGGILGFPYTNIVTCYSSPQGTTGTQASFEGGAIYSGSGKVGTHVISGAIFNVYAVSGQTWSGGTAGILGFPITDIFACNKSPKGTTGSAAGFEGGGIYSGSGSVGTHPVYGDIFQQYAATPGTGGPYGFPISDPYAWNGGTRQDFEGGSLESSAVLSTHILWKNANNAASFWNLNADSSYTYHSFGPYPGWTATGIADGPDGHVHVLWNSASGAMSLWNLDNADGTFTQTIYGPYAGWNAQTVAVGPDNLAHVLWAHPADGQVSLWAVDASGGYAFHNYGPFAGWSAQDLTVGPDDAPHILWTNTNGAISVWNVDGSGGYAYQNYGPFAGWSASRMAAGPDNLLRVLWTHAPDGALSVWRLNNGAASYTHQEYGPFGGWGVAGLSVGSDNQTRVLWDHAGDEEMSLWSVDPAGNPTHAEYGPFGGWTATGVGAP